MTTNDLWWGQVQIAYLRGFNKKAKFLSQIAFSAPMKNCLLFKMEEKLFFQRIDGHFSKENEIKKYLLVGNSEAPRIRCGCSRTNLLNYLILLTSFI